MALLAADSSFSSKVVIPAQAGIHVLIALPSGVQT
jgi:hypothetical protein